MVPCGQITGQLSNVNPNFKWEVSRTAIVDCENKDDKLLSAEFSVGNSRWQLCLQPKGNADSKDGFMAISLCLRSFTTQVLNISIEIYLVNVHSGQASVLVESRNTEFSNGSSHVFTDFTDRYNLFYGHEEFLVDDNIPIFLKIVPRCNINNEVPVTFENLFGNEKFSDVKIALGNNEYLHAHKNILASQSSVFAAMFEHKMKENIENLITIKDIDRDVVMAMVHFMYSGKVNDIEKVALRLFIAADRYDVGSLKFVCEEYLCNSLSPENAVECLVLADKYDARKLYTKAIDFTVSNISVIIDKPEFTALSAGSGNCVLLTLIRKLILLIPNSVSRIKQCGNCGSTNLY